MKQVKQGKEKKEEKRSLFFPVWTVVFVLIIALEEIEDYVPALSFDELKELEAEVMQSV